MNGIDGDVNQNLKLSVKPDGHGFIYEYSDEILSFIWDKLNYGELQPPGNQNANPAPGTFQSFDQLEFFPDTTNWQSNDFRDR
jgi:hypothetical protein